jgi:hypothetical protein
MIATTAVMITIGAGIAATMMTGGVITTMNMTTTSALAH